MPVIDALNGYYSDVIIGTMGSQITSLTIVYSTVYSGADQTKHQSSASQAFARGILRWHVNSPHKGPVTRKMFPFGDVIMIIRIQTFVLTHWARVTHICVSKLTIIGLDNGLSPGRHQAITENNAGILLIRTIGTNFSEILIEIDTFSLTKNALEMSSAKWQQICLGLNVLIVWHFSKNVYGLVSDIRIAHTKGIN